MTAIYSEKSLRQKTAVLLFVLPFFMMSCGQDKNNGHPAEKTNDADTVQNTTATTFDALLPLFKKAALPYVIDTAFFSRVNDYDSLNTSQLRLLVNGWGQNELVQTATYYLDKFYEIDSVKVIGKYKEWCETLDIGMTQESKAYALTQLELNASTRIMVWALEYSSYPACPHFAGTTVYFTVVHKGIPGQSFLLGEVMGGGDPPSSMERTITGSISSTGHVELNKYELMDEDMDLPTVDVSESRFVMQIGAGSIDKIEEFAEPIKKVEREKIQR